MVQNNLILRTGVLILYHDNGATQGFFKHNMVQNNIGNWCVNLEIINTDVLWICQIKVHRNDCVGGLWSTLLKEISCYQLLSAAKSFLPAKKERLFLMLIIWA